jgi:hypothetical protein
MAEPCSFSNFNAAMSVMNHIYFNPVVGALSKRGRRRLRECETQDEFAVRHSFLLIEGR